ncbi:S8 family serine peptidase [Candidatus Fermentibacteria bacterium]|nr:S8 family serine peptidase [Candidatus Fermentibacteria bacterium]
MITILAVFVLAAQPGLSIPPSPAPGISAHDVMVIAKVEPELSSVLPRGRTFETGIPVLDQSLRRAGIVEVERLHPDVAVRADLPRLDLFLQLHPGPGVSPAQVVTALTGHPALQYVEAVEVPRPVTLPNDPSYPAQYALPQVWAPEAWDVQQGDRAVVVAIVDNGTDFTHPDLLANVYTNEAEANGLPGVDDDGNGYVDDVHGFDVAHDDPDPSPCPPDAEGWWSHGTLVAGVAAAVTDNALGVASVSWNCSYLPVKASYDATPGSVARGYSGIVYAADTGADVINCSWGSYGVPSQYNQEVIDYATGLGSLVIAAAGNDPVGDPHYPSAYRNTVSVTWVDRNDRRNPSATWGRTVDVSAPGVGILSTSPGGYGSASGSSLASPMAAGLAGLIKAGYPGLTPFELARRLVLTADTIDAINPGFEGLLGTGRINAYRAVTETDLVEQPYLETVGWSVTDPLPGGNGDGWILPGETGHIVVTYRNYTVSPAYGTTVTLSADAPGIVIVQGVSDEGDVPADTTQTCSTPLSFLVDPCAPSQTVDLLLTYQASGGFCWRDTLSVAVGLSPILLVDDDDGSVNVEEYYLTVLDSLNIPVLRWDYSVSGVPGAELLSGFPLVIWACEWAFPSLTPEDRASLAAYLDAGGSLYLSGQDIGWDLCDPSSQNTSPEAVAWYQTYLGASYVADVASGGSVTGVPGDPIGHGLSFSVYQPGREPANQYPSVISPLPGAWPVFRYTPGECGAVRFFGQHRSLYTAFGFEAIASGQVLDPVDYTGVRTTLMGRVLDMLGPIIHEPLGDIEAMDAPLNVSALMHGPGTPDSLWLLWEADEAGFTEVLMTELGAGSFVAQIPAPGQPADIRYTLEARCPAYSWSLPAVGVFEFHVGPDHVPPVVGLPTQLASTIFVDSSRPVAVMASDNLGLDTESGLIRYMAGDIEGQLALSFEEWVGRDGLFGGALGQVGVLGDTVHYFCTVTDTAAMPNTGASETLRYVYGLDDFENGLDVWDPGDDWALISGGSAYSGQWIVTDSPSGPYPNNASNSLTLMPGLDLSSATAGRVSFWVKYGLEDGHDFCHVEASRDGEEWRALLSLTGRQMAWTRFEATLGEFVGEGCDSVLIRFRLVSDESGQDVGVYLDDVYIDTRAGSATGSQPLPERPRLVAHPNPSRGSVIFRASPGCETAGLRLYDLAGRLVTTIAAPGSDGSYEWAGTDDLGRPVGSGVYCARLAGAPLEIRVVLIR